MLAMGEIHPRTHRASATRLVRVQADFTHEIAMVELNDPQRMNSFSQELAEDVVAAAASISRLSSDVHAIVLQGSGPHFSVGGNPFQRDLSEMPLPSAAARI